MKTVKLAIGTSTVNIGYPDVTLPIALGYWKDEGLDVEVMTTGGTLQAVQQVIGGGADIVEGNVSALLQGIAQNELPLKVLVTHGVTDWKFVVPEGSAITDAKGLEGKKIGMISLATGGIPLLKSYLSEVNVPADSVEVIPVGFGAAPLEALKNGDVDALLYWGSAVAAYENCDRAGRGDACGPAGRVSAIWSGAGRGFGGAGHCNLGGMAATNAGGMQAFRNGVMRHRVLGLEAVLANGEILSDMTQVIKSTSGYDVKHLLIGSEGTLGIITRLVVSLVPLPQGSATALLALPDAACALKLTAYLRKTSDVSLLTSELMTRDFVQMNAEAQGLSLPTGIDESPMSLLVEIAGSSDAEAVAQLETVLSTLPDDIPVTDGTNAQTLKQRDELWHLREDMSVYARRYSGYLSCDISVPCHQIDRYLELLKQRMAKLSPPIEALIFAHIADGNLHVITKCAHLAGAARTAAEDAIYAPLADLGGSISAEHGIGIKKSRAYNAHVAAPKRQMIAQIKAALDPLNILNPNLFPREDLIQQEHQS